jgi:hypothetical protein
MGTHMKTTVDIADGLFEDAKRIAERRGVTLRALIEEGLRHVIAEQRPGKPFKLKDGSVGGEGLQPGIRPGDWKQISALIYGHEYVEDEE